ncbi:hypothetical protein [Lysobacter firmicutimachus]|uniref:Uncharacterized protein n=1 Tax=Lysobacter firmicutimachus TaxID=1792846 RepID=A0ABU8CY89_9GAMM
MSEVTTQRYASISPALDWFFVHADANPKNPPTVYRLAAWGIGEDGTVIGLVGAFGHEIGKRRAPHLISIPPVPGQYLHASQLSDIERDQSIKR